jgi:hypothetical protein
MPLKYPSASVALDGRLQASLDNKIATLSIYLVLATLLNLLDVFGFFWRRVPSVRNV